MLEKAALSRPLEVFVKVNTGMNRLGFAPGDVADVCRRLSSCAGGRGAAAHDASRARRRGRRHRRAAARVRARLPGPAVSALDRQLGRRDPLRRSRRRHRAARASCSTARRRSPTTRRTMLGLQPVMTLRSRSSPCRSSRANDSVGYGGDVHGVARRIASAWSPAATPTAIRAMRPTARRCSCAARKVRTRRPRVDGHAHRRPDRRARSARRQSRSCCGAKGCRSTTSPARRRTVGYELLCARRAARAASCTSDVGARRPRTVGGALVYIVVTGAAGLHRLEPRAGAQRARRDRHHRRRQPRAAPTSSATSSTATSPTTSTRTSSSRASRRATSTTTSRRCCTRARARTRWRATAAT